MGMGATFTHLLLFNYDDMKAAWSWLRPRQLRKMYARFDLRFWRDDGVRFRELANVEDLDPHYREMLKASSDIFGFFHSHFLS